MRRALGTLTTWDSFEKAIQEHGVYVNGSSAIDDDAESSRDIGHMEHEAYQDRQTLDHLQEAYTGTAPIRSTHGMVHLHHSQSGQRQQAVVAAYP